MPPRQALDDLFSKLDREKAARHIVKFFTDTQNENQFIGSSKALARAHHPIHYSACRAFDSTSLKSIHQKLLEYHETFNKRFILQVAKPFIAGLSKQHAKSADHMCTALSYYVKIIHENASTEHAAITQDGIGIDDAFNYAATFTVELLLFLANLIGESGTHNNLNRACALKAIQGILSKLDEIEDNVLKILQRKIVESLQDGWPAVRVLAIETLCARDGLLIKNFDSESDAPYDDDVITLLVEGLGDSDLSVCKTVAQHLPAIMESKTQDTFVSCVKDARPSLRRQIVSRYGQQSHFRCLNKAQRLQLLKHLMPVYQRKAWQSRPGTEKPDEEKLKRLEKELEDDREAVDKMGYSWFKYLSAAQPSLEESDDVLFRLLVLYTEDIMGGTDDSVADSDTVIFAVTTVLNGGGLKLVFDENILEDLDICRALVLRAYAGHVKKGEHDQHLNLTAVSKTLESIRNKVDALEQMDDTTVQVFHELMRIIPLLDSDDVLGASKVASELDKIFEADKLADEIYQACVDAMESVEPVLRHRVDRLVTIISPLNPLPERTEEEIEEEEERDQELAPEEQLAAQKRRRDGRMQSYRSGLSTVSVEEFDRKIRLCLVRLIAVLKGIPQTSTLGEHQVLMGTMEEFVRPFLDDPVIHQNRKLRELAWQAHICFVLLSRKTEEIDTMLEHLIRFLRHPATGAEMRQLCTHGFFDFIVERGPKASSDQYNKAMLCLHKLIQDDKPEQDIWLGLYKLVYSDRIPDEHKEWVHVAVFEQYFLTTDPLLVPVFGEVNKRIANRSATNNNNLGRKFYDLFKKLYVDKVLGQPRVNATECIKTIFQWSDPRDISDAKEQRDCVGVHTDIIAPDLLKMILYIRNPANHSLERAEATTLKNTLVNCLTDGKIIVWPEKHDAQAMISLWIYVTAVLEHNAVGKKDAKTGSPSKLRKFKEALEKEYEAVREIVGMSDEDQRAQYHETFGDIDDLVPSEVQEEQKGTKRPKREQTGDTDGNEVPKYEPMDEENPVPPQEDAMKPEPEEDEVPLPRRTSGRITKKRQSLVVDMEDFMVELEEPGPSSKRRRLTSVSMTPPPLAPPIIKRRSRQGQRDDKKDERTPKIKSEDVTAPLKVKKRKSITGPGSSKDKAIVLSDDEGGAADAPIDISSDDDSDIVVFPPRRTKHKYVKKEDSTKDVKREDVTAEGSKFGEGTANKPIHIDLSDSEDEQDDNGGEHMEEVQEEDEDTPPDLSPSPSPEPGRVPNPDSIFDKLDPEDYENEADSIFDGTDGYDSIMGPPSSAVSRTGTSASQAGPSWGVQDGDDDEWSENSEMEVENSLIIDADD